MKVELSGVPETLLWTLYYRATEARRPDAVIDDPRAVELLETIDYPFDERFGPSQGPQAQWQALRARCFDDQVRDFMGRCPGGTVVALGEGLETGFWRVDDGRVRWLTVDLPETLAVRRELLGDDPPRRRSIACSATDERWIDEVDPSDGVLVTAQGLLMYLRREEVDGIVRACARRLPGATLVFDTAPRWFALLAQRGALRTPAGYVAPPMPWGWDVVERLRFERAHPEIARLDELPLPVGRGVTGLAIPLLSRLPLLREVSLVVVRAELRR
ncbi:MAG TPA: class I SAM-dependent methyltransferase [Capillimicrobium sp.]|nr:class I SAM-dependent methyltransferase [Capillimicrobium sp.]